MAWRRGPWWHYAACILISGYLTWGLVAGATAAADQRGWLGAALHVVLYAFALASCVVALLRESLRANTSWLAAAAVAGLAMHALAAYTGVGLLFLVVWIAPFRTRLWHAVTLTVFVAGGFMASSFALSLPSEAIFGVAAGLGWAGFFAAVVHQLVVTRQQAAAVALAQSREAVLAERQRLAREIHDILAHSLSAQVMNLEGARLMLERDGGQDLVLDRVIRAGDLARTGLEETKRAVEALRGDQAPLTDQLERLARDFRAATGQPCEFSFSGDPVGLTPEAWLAVVRTAQEALTNVHKHAPNAQVTMGVRCRGRWCELEVRDTGGQLGELTAVGSGYGLVGMRERAELIGGTLDAGPAGDGFRVQLRVPA